MGHVFVTIPIASTWPSPNELAARNAVMAALDVVGFGTCTGAGGGVGEMDFSYEVDDESATGAAIAQAMGRHMPGMTYRVRVSEE